MPESANEHLDWLRKRIAELNPRTILDVGMGRGNYGWFLRQDMHWQGRLVGIEIWAPYVSGPNPLAGGNLNYYNAVFIKDVRDAGPIIKETGADVIFAFDVIEHMPFLEGSVMIQRLREHTKELLVSVPIVPYPQGPLHGNPHEAHQHDWTVEEMQALGGPLVSRGVATGLFQFIREQNVGIAK